MLGAGKDRVNPNGLTEALIYNCAIEIGAPAIPLYFTPRQR
jgi:hypothetical protein